VGYTCQRRRSRRAAQLILSGWSQREVRHWSSCAEEEALARSATLSTQSTPAARRAQKHAAMVAQEAERRIEMGKRVIKHMLHQQLAVAWDHFVHCVDSRRSARVLMRKTVVRMRHRRLTQAFERFAYAASTAADQRRKVQSVVARWRHPRVRAAFELWWDHIDGLLRARAERVHSAWRRWGLREVWEAFQAWHHYAVGQRLEVLTCYQVYSHVGQAHRLRLLSQCWEAWQDAQAETPNAPLLDLVKAQAQQQGRHGIADAAAAANSKIAAEVGRRVELCQSLLKRMLKHQLSLAWNSFAHAASAARAQRETCGKVLARMQHRRAAMAFDTFVQHVHTLVDARAKLTRALMQWTEPGLTWAFDTWVLHVHDEQEAREAGRAEEVNEVLLNELLNSTKHAYYAVDQEVSRRIQIAKRALSRILQQQLAASWNHFVAQVAEVKRRRRILRRVLARMTRRATLAAFTRLALHAEQRRDARARMRALVSRWRNSALYNGFHLWLAASESAGPQPQPHSPRHLRSSPPPETGGGGGGGGGSGGEDAATDGTSDTVLCSSCWPRKPRSGRAGEVGGEGRGGGV